MMRNNKYAIFSVTGAFHFLVCHCDRNEMEWSKHKS